MFDTVIAGHNTKLYVRFTDATAGTRVDKVVELTPGDYTLTSLVTELQTKLQAAMPTTGDFVSAVLTVTEIGDSKLQLAITGASLVDTASRMEILTFSQLRLGDFGYTKRGPEQEQMRWISTTCRMRVPCVGSIRVSCFALKGPIRRHSTFPFRPTGIYTYIAVQRRSR